MNFDRIATMTRRGVEIDRRTLSLDVQVMALESDIAALRRRLNPEMETPMNEPVTFAKRAEMQLDELIRRYAQEHKISYADALERVKADPANADLVRAYALGR